MGLTCSTGLAATTSCWRWRRGRLRLQHRGFGTDTVQDFATTAAAGANHDYVDFRGIPALSSFAITQVGADAHIVTNHGTVILQGITASTLVAGDSCSEAGSPVCIVLDADRDCAQWQ